MDKPLKDHLKDAERAYWEQVLTETKGNVRQAADIAKVNHMLIYRHCPKLGVYPTRYRERKE